MSALLWTLGSIGYGLLALTTWCAGSFGIAATTSDRHQAAHKRADAEWHGSRYVAEYTKKYAKASLYSLAWLTFAAGFVWPVAIPMYLAYRKGSFIDNAVVERSELVEQRERVAELEALVKRLTYGKSLQ